MAKDPDIVLSTKTNNTSCGLRTAIPVVRLPVLVYSEKIQEAETVRCSL